MWSFALCVLLFWGRVHAVHWLAWGLLCRSGWPGTHWDLPAPFSWVLELKVGTAMPSFFVFCNTLRMESIPGLKLLLLLEHQVWHLSHLSFSVSLFPLLGPSSMPEIAGPCTLDLPFAIEHFFFLYLPRIAIQCLHICARHQCHMLLILLVHLIEAILVKCSTDIFHF